MTGAPARAAWAATKSSRSIPPGSGPSGKGIELETRATTGDGRRCTSTCHASRRTTGSSQRTPCSRATASAAAIALSLMTGFLAEAVRHAREDHARLEEQEALDVERPLVVQQP